MVTEDWIGAQNANQESLTQAIGRAAHAAGLEAVLVPSSAFKTGKNLVWFPENLEQGSTVNIQNVGRLPPGTQS